MLNRRRFLTTTVQNTALLAVAAAVLPDNAAWARGQKENKSVLVYISSYADEKTPGIRLYDFDTATGALTLREEYAGVNNPSFLAVHPSKKFLYAASEAYGADGGRIVAFAIDAKTGELTEINRESTKGAGPCFARVRPDGKCVFVANYGSGTVSALPITETGALKSATGFAQHEGHGPNEKRQKEPHAHSFNPSPDGRFAIAADLGIDKLLVYRVAEDGKLTPNDPPFTATKPGAGPRHLAFHPNNKLAFVINEIDNTLVSYRWDSDKGTLTELDRVATLPEGYTGESTTAEVVVHPKGKFVYGSNRGLDSIVRMSVEPETGKLTVLGQTLTGGRNPRNFALDPTGAFLLAAHQDTGDVRVFKVNPDTGDLTPTGTPVNAPKSVCVRFL